MKILQISASYKPAYVYGGPTMSVSRLCEQMMCAGHTIEVYATTANGKAELKVTPNKKVIVDGVDVTYFKRLTKDHTHFSPALLTKLWKEIKNFELVHIHAWWNLVSVFSCWIAIIRRVPVVVSPRGTLSAYSFKNKNDRKKKILHWFLGKQLLNKSYIHVTSLREKKGIEAIIKPEKIINIPNFVVLSQKKFSANRPVSGLLKLLFFSRIEEKKGLDILLNSLAKVKVPYHLTIAGDGEAGYIDELKNIAANNGVSEHLTWIGFQGSNKFDILRQHDLMVLPSHDENFGNVVIESLSVGTAVLLSKYVGLAEYVADNKLGWVCDLDEKSISNSIDAIAQNIDKLSAIRKQAPGQIVVNFNDETLTKKYIDMYQQIINNERI